jgi:hypothetical protein
MIQGCRYLWRPTDRWLLSKNSTTRLKDSEVGAGPVCCEIVRSLLQTLRVYIYTLVLTRLLVDHEYNINVPAPMFVLHPSSIRPFLIFRPRHHVFPNAPFSKRKQPFCRMMVRYRPQVPLPNPLKKTFLPNGVSLPNSAHKSVSLLYQFLVLTLPHQRTLLCEIKRFQINTSPHRDNQHRNKNSHTKKILLTHLLHLFSHLFII